MLKPKDLPEANAKHVGLLFDKGHAPKKMASLHNASAEKRTSADADLRAGREKNSSLAARPDLLKALRTKEPGSSFSRRGKQARLRVSQ